MNLQWLIYFQTIAELENYTQATKKLHVSQSNLSHAMRSLEEKLGVELFEKDGRNIRLPNMGKSFSLMSIKRWIPSMKVSLN